MRVVIRGIACLSLVAGAGAVSEAGRRAEQAPTPTETIWSGAYSAAQAKRGLLEYTGSCEHCHGATLTGNAGDEVPSLVADAFMFHWRGRTVQDLYARVSQSMPADAPGSLNAGKYRDVVAYLLEANGFPSGPHDLNPDRLTALVIQKRP
jgi:S-disulfanyl-L-cysteine oxidoreductase SoxD